METLADYLTRLASETPTPGGGSAATIVAASGAALVAMVARINGSNPKYAEQRALAADLVALADDLRVRLLDAGRRDEAAFGGVVEAQALPKISDVDKSARRAALESALRNAAEEPLAAANLALEVLSLAQRSLEMPNRNLASDLGCAAEFASAGIAACAYNVRVNHRFMRDQSTIDAQARALYDCERRAATLLNDVRSAVTALLSA